MHIPGSLPQFRRSPVLIIVSGQFEARFFIAHAGEIKELETIRHIPREETIGKDWGYAKSSSATPSSGAVSSQGKRRLTLRKKFQKEAVSHIQSEAGDKNIQEIYFFAPTYVSSGILKQLDSHTKERIRKVFDGEYTKESPAAILYMITESRRITRGTSGA